jgi:hypothetical protein
MGVWFAIGLAVAVAAVVGFKALTTRAVLRGRTSEPLEKIHAPVKDQVSFETLSEVLSLLGRSYGIDPGLLRPTDTFVELAKIDSWTLGKAEDDVGEWLKAKGVEAPRQLDTVLDLAMCVKSLQDTNAARK